MGLVRGFQTMLDGRSIESIYVFLHNQALEAQDLALKGTHRESNWQGSLRDIFCNFVCTMNTVEFKRIFGLDYVWLLSLISFHGSKHDLISCST